MTSATDVPAVTCWPTCTGVASGASAPEMPARTCKRRRLLFIEIEQRLGLVDLGLLRGELHLDRFLVHIELLLAELVLRCQLVGRALWISGKPGRR